LLAVEAITREVSAAWDDGKDQWGAAGPAYLWVRVETIAPRLDVVSGVSAEGGEIRLVMHEVVTAA